jgi:two-component system chemotaxis response regulator CheB
MIEGRIFTIGASAGGVTAIQSILSALPENFDAPLCVIHHLPENSFVDPSQVYVTGGGRLIVEIEDKMPVEKNRVYFAPGGYHTLIEREGTFALSQDAPVQYSRPSIDVFFESVANAFGTRAVAALLTGASEDGARGLGAIKSMGGISVVQDPKQAEFPTMPEAAFKFSHPHFVADLQSIPELFVRLAEGRGVV